jgi:hypothetical protein
MHTIFIATPAWFDQVFSLEVNGSVVNYLRAGVSKFYTSQLPPISRRRSTMNARDPNLSVQADETSALGAYAARQWDEQIVPALDHYIGVPAKSPMFDVDWHAHGHRDLA